MLTERQMCEMEEQYRDPFTGEWAGTIVEYWNGNCIEGYDLGPVKDGDCYDLSLLELKDEPFYTFRAVRQAAGTDFEKLLYMAVTFDEARNRITKVAYFRNRPVNEKELYKLRSDCPHTTFYVIDSTSKEETMEAITKEKKNKIRPISFAEANRFIKENHRHNSAVTGGKFAIAVEDENGELIGVATCGRPVSRVLQEKEPYTLEISRVCSIGSENVCSMLYGRCVSIAKDLGYEKVITYTLHSESGASLRAAGFSVEETDAGRNGWTGKRSQKNAENHEDDYRFPAGRKYRWMKKTA